MHSQRGGRGLSAVSPGSVSLAEWAGLPTERLVGVAVTQ